MAKRLVLLKEQEAVHENNAEEKDDKLEHALFKTDGLMEFGNKIGTGDIDEHASRESGDKGHGRFNNSSKAEDSESAEDGKESRNEIEQKGFGARKSGAYRRAVYQIMDAVGNKYQMPDRMNGAVIRRKFFFAVGVMPPEPFLKNEENDNASENGERSGLGRHFLECFRDEMKERIAEKRSGGERNEKKQRVSQAFLAHGKRRKADERYSA